MADRILRRREVEQRIGLSRSTLYLLIQRGQFPAPVKLTGKRAVGWYESAVDRWITERGEAA